MESGTGSDDDPPNCAPRYFPKSWPLPDFNFAPMLLPWQFRSDVRKSTSGIGSKCRANAPQVTSLDNLSQLACVVRNQFQKSKHWLPKIPGGTEFVRKSHPVMIIRVVVIMARTACESTCVLLRGGLRLLYMFGACLKASRSEVSGFPRAYQFPYLWRCPGSQKQSHRHSDEQALHTCEQIRKV